MTAKNISELLDSVFSSGGSRNNRSRILTPDDFNKLPESAKKTFLFSLYSALEREYEQAAKALEDPAGLNLHFKITNRSNLSLANIPSAVFLRKAAFFANIFVITFPFKQFRKMTVEHNNKIHETKFKRGELIKNPGYFPEQNESGKIIVGKIDTHRCGYGGEVDVIGPRVP